MYRSSHILIVDDEPANCAVLTRLLNQHGFGNIQATTDPRDILVLMLETPPDLIMLDLHMPHLDGFAVMELLKPWLADGPLLPILVLTADATRDTRLRALAGGAKDFLTKPFDATEVLLRVENLLETRALHTTLFRQNARLEEKVQERTREVEQSRLEMLERLSTLVEARDDLTHRHMLRVGENAARLAAALGDSADAVELLRRAAPLHDVGKVGIPDHVLLKPSRLTPDEYAVIREHTLIGARILADSGSPVLQLAERIARFHHERWDGDGYHGVAGAAIPREASIVSIVDVFDALTHVRPYKTAWPLNEAIGEIRRLAGQAFDPELVAVFLELHRRGEVLVEPGSPRLNARVVA
ncbi:MAG: response regulator [Chloroflexi bacterium]|nr:response regulator [Chloroflexota bacterium]